MPTALAERDTVGVKAGFTLSNYAFLVRTSTSRRRAALPRNARK